MNATVTILEKIKSYQTIMIHRHQSPDPDALGSQGGLAEILKTTFPNKQIFCIGGPVNDLDYLLTMDEVSDEMYKGALVISTDTANESRVSGSQYQLGKEIIKIDHHPNDEPYGDFSWINTEASSTSEMIYDFYEAHQSELKMTDAAAKLLYAGIIGDTGRFLYPATTSHTLWVASKLRDYDFDASALTRKMDEITVKVARMSGYVTENLIIDENGAAMILLSQEILDKFDMVDSETPALISVPGKIETVKAWGIFVAQPEGHYRVRLRSKGPVINQIAKRYRGGGHPLASGANAKDLEEVKEVFNEIKQVVKDFY
ncbi:DHH family phosphoesterase [Vagococcus vulneris]|uniref:DHH family phosphoesterase n=1 Tax=Vagococcus vulneris TaxID=1977869 RepID=A0A429ZV51_9ENTE|nr:bifunctional oligoribonuclease/PAP phosphatase NrnA [Vagococcus vulneris]RST97630.1 DHH family phosphoesterase [Vagococcus vulneris]